jgi:MFS family permease
MSNTNQRWLWSLLVNVAAAQASIYVMRPMITYRALENGASTFEIGLIASIYALTPMLVAVSMGRWVGRFGEVPLLISGSIAFIFLAGGLIFLNDVAALAAMTAMAGIAHLANVAASQSLVASKSPNELQDQNFGYFSFSASLGHTIGPVLGGLIAGSAGVLPRSSSAAFIFAAILAFISLVPLLTIKEMRERRSKEDREVAAAIRARDVLRRPGIKPAIWTSLSVASVNDVLVVILPLVGTETGISPVIIGFILSLRSGAAMISRFLLGKLSNRFGTSRLMNYSISLAALFLALTIFAKSAIPLGILMVIIGFLLGVGQPLTMSIVSKKSPIEERAMAISIRLFGNRFGQFIVPIGAGAIAAPFGSSAIFAGLAAWLASAAAVSMVSLADEVSS